MTTKYADEISDGRGVSVFLKILKKWKGSLYKLVWVDLLIYILVYYILNLSYRFAMNEKQKQIFEDIVQFCEKTKGDIPISFLLGFFVAGIISRWYQMYLYIPWMNQIALHIAACINGRDEENSRKIRLTIMRYMNLSWVLMMQLISDQIASRFIPSDDGQSVASSLHPSTTRRRNPQHKHVITRNACHPWSIDTTGVLRTSSTSATRSFIHSHASKHESNNQACAPTTPQSPDPTMPLAPLATTDEYGGLPNAFTADDVVKWREKLRALNRDRKVKNTFGVLITESEIAAFERIAAEFFRRNRSNHDPEYWIPMQWAQRLTLKALESGYILDPKTAYYTIENIGRLRKQMQDLHVYSSIMIPLVYTQVVIIAVYSYFMCQIFACQFVRHRHGAGDHKIDLYVPIFSIFSFLFLMGWLKVALCVMNPFGDDDEDFQTSKILDYNLEVSYRCVNMDNGAFPDYMSMPMGKRKKADSDEPDDLFDFLHQIDEELNKIPDRQTPNDVSNLEVKPTCCGRARELLCYQPPARRAPYSNNREQTLLVTNAEYCGIYSQQPEQNFVNGNHGFQSRQNGTHNPKYHIDLDPYNNPFIIS